MNDETAFDEPARDSDAPTTLVVDLDVYEGPLDVLLALARNQKVDLTRISILRLAEQYLAFIQAARRLSLEIAADYLVMAAWLAYLKSRLLLPDSGDEEEPSGEEMAARLAFQLRRLEAMRDAAARLMARHRLGQDVFPRGMPEGVRVIRSEIFEVSLYELIKAYADQHNRRLPAHMRIAPPPVYTVEMALGRLRELLGSIPDWQTLESFLPAALAGEGGMRSAVASTFAASLELAKRGHLELRQGSAFGPLYIRKAGRLS